MLYQIRQVGPLGTILTWSVEKYSHIFPCDFLLMWKYRIWINRLTVHEISGVKRPNIFPQFKWPVWSLETSQGVQIPLVVTIQSDFSISILYLLCEFCYCFSSDFPPNSQSLSQNFTNNTVTYHSVPMAYDPTSSLPITFTRDQISNSVCFLVNLKE